MESDMLSILRLHQSAQSAFGTGDTKKTLAIVKGLFDPELDTLATLVEFFTLCKDLKSNKSLAYLVAKELGKWYSQQEEENKSSSIEVDADLKTSLMPIVVMCHSATASILIKVYKLNKPPNDFLKPYITDLIARERLKEAISVTYKLGMQEQFSLYDMALPMLTQNKINLVEEYLNGSKTQQLEMLKLIDSWLQTNFDLITFLQEKDIFQVRCEILRPKFLIKLLSRWLRMFMEVDDPYSGKGQEICPNLCKQKSLTNLRYLLRRHYVEEVSSVETTQELIMKAVGNDKWLQEQLVDLLGSVHGDWESAKQWAKLYGVKHETLVSYLNNLGYSIDGGGDRKTDEVEEVWECDIPRKQRVSPPGKYDAGSTRNEDSENWYDLSLPLGKVEFVDSASLLQQCTQRILKHDLLGLDSEWVPEFARSGVVSVALLQIATIENVFLIDISHLCNSGQENKDALCDLVRKIMGSNDILKIGFGISEDLRKLEIAIPELSEDLKSPMRVTDLCISVRLLERLYPKIFDFPEETLNDVEMDMPGSKKETGLSKLVQRCLGKPLNKCEQLSDWERRPLRQSQVIYASLDAYVLLELCNFIHTKMKLAGIEHTLETIKNVQSTKKRVRIREKKRDPGGASSSNDESSSQVARNDNHIVRKEIRPHEFKVVCDTMLQGLGRQLRCCGVDVKILSNYDDHEVAAEIAVREKRIILTSGAPFQYLTSQVPIGDCFDVPCGEKAKDQAAVVLEHYNVKVTPQDIFSRCQVCNGNKYLKVAPDIMQKCMKRRREILQGKQRQGLSSNAKAHPIPWEELRLSNAASKMTVGRGRHVTDTSDSASTKYPRNIGRGRTLRECGLLPKSGTINLLSIPGLSSQIREKCNVSIQHGKSDDYSAYDDEDDDIMVCCSSSPDKVSRSPEFAPIESKSSDQSENESQVDGIFYSKTSIVSKDLTFSDDNIMKTEQEIFVATETCTGIMHTDNDAAQNADTGKGGVHFAEKDGVIPYIINPKSICTQGVVNIENVTIVSSVVDAQGDSSSVDSVTTPLLCEQIPPNMLTRVKVFYCCVKCGKVFWEGRHFTAVLEQFSQILSEE